MRLNGEDPDQSTTGGSNHSIYPSIHLAAKQDSPPRHIPLLLLIGGVLLLMLLIAAGMYLTPPLRNRLLPLRNALLLIAPPSVLPLGSTSPPPPPSTSLATAPAINPPARTTTVVPLTDAWSGYENPTIGLSLRTPPGWNYRQHPQALGVELYPQDIDPPAVLISFDQTVPYDPHPTPEPDIPSPQPITIDGITGRQYEDVPITLPVLALSIHLPYRGGTLFIAVFSRRLVPQFREILKTVVLIP